MPFFVSVVVLRSDDECHLQEYPEPSREDRTKHVKLSIARGQRYREYLPPIGFFFALSVVLVLLGFLVMASKRLSALEGCGSDATDEPSVYYSPKQSREELEAANPKRRRRPREGEEEGEEKEEEDVDQVDGPVDGDNKQGSNGEIKIVSAHGAEEGTEEGGGGDSIQPMVAEQGEELLRSRLGRVVLFPLQIIKCFISIRRQQETRSQHPQRPEAEGSFRGQEDQQRPEDGEDREGSRQVERGGAAGRHDQGAQGGRLVQEEQIQGLRVPRPPPLALLLHPFHSG